MLQSAHVLEAAAIAAGPMSEQLHGHKLEAQTLGLALEKVADSWPVTVAGP